MSARASIALLRARAFLCGARIFNGGRGEPRSTSTWAAVSAFLMSCLSLSACGGGGGGGGSSSSLSVSLSPSSVTATFQQGTAYSFNETATVTGSIPNTVYILITDSADSIQQNIAIQQQSNNSFVATITTLTTLPVGSRQGTLTLELCGDSACSQVLASTSLPYNFTVSAPPPALSVTPQSLNFAAVMGSTQAPAAQPLNVSVSGLKWTVSASTSWLSLSAATGQGTGTVNVSVNPAGLSTGTNSGSVTVTDSDGTSAVIPVTLTVTASQLTLNPQALTFTVAGNTSTASLTQTVAVSDQLSGQAGDPGLQWSAGSVSVPWLQITPTSGNSSFGSSANVSIVPTQLASMANGSYSGTIAFSYTSADGIPHTLALPVSLLLNSPLQSITVTPANPPAAISEGPTVQFTAIGGYADGYSQNLSGQVNWTSSATSIATINNSGQVQPLAPGNTIISAAMPGTAISGSTHLTVQAPTGLAYVVNSTDGTVSQFIFNSNGILQPMATPTAPTGNNPFAIAFAPSNQFAYVVNYGDSTISQYSVSSGGTLTPLNPATVSVAGYSPVAIAIDPSGQHAYVSAWGNVYAVLQFSIGANGILSAMTTPAVSAGSAPEGLVVHPSGKYAYVTNLNSNTVSQYSIDVSGNLVSMGTVAAGSDPQQIVIDPTGQYAYVVNMSFTDEVPSPNGYISQYSIGSNGALTPMATPMVAAGVEPWALALSPTGTYAYVANGGVADDGGTVSGFTIGTEGSLIPFSGPQTPAQVAPRDIAVDPSGQFVYVLNQGNNDVWQYTIGAGGVLTQIGTTATGNGGRAMVVRAP